jgi:hypothetical protein
LRNLQSRNEKETQERIELPAVVRDWAEMKDGIGSVDGEVSIAKLNDDGMSLSKMASFIEKNINII